MTLYSGQRPSAALLNSIIPAYDTGVYTPVLTRSDTAVTPALGATGYITGIWFRTGLAITAYADLNIAGAGASIAGTSWRISLPFLADDVFHGNLDGTLNDLSDVIGNYHTRSGTTAQITTGAVVLSSYNDGTNAGRAMIFYLPADNNSLGSASFTTSARIKAKVHYVADPSEF